MPKEYTLIHPDIDQGRGRTRELVDEIVRSWREGKNEGAGEIAAVVDFLSNDEGLPADAFRLTGEGPSAGLAREFLKFLSEMPGRPPPFAARVAREGGWKGIPINVACVATATGALYAALAAAGVEGGEVIATSLNYVGVANAIVMAGAAPRFVDIDEGTWCMDPEAAAKALGKKTRAIVLTHVNRLPDIEPYYDIVKDRGGSIPLIQDASLSIGSTSGGIRPGVINAGRGGATVMSLTVSKPISGLGGAVVAANDPSTIARIMSISHQGISFTEAGALSSFGANIKMCALNAAVALEALKRRGEIFSRRRELRALYDECLAPLVKKKKIALQDVGDEAVVTHYGVLLPDREKLAKMLYERHRIHIGMWHVLHMQKIYRKSFGPRLKKLPVTEALAKRVAFLPFHTRLSDPDVRFICGALADAINAL